MGVGRVQLDVILVEQVRNDSGAVRRFVEVVATRYNAGGSVVGCAFTFVNSMDLEPGQMGAFELSALGIDPGVVASYRLQVTALP